MELPSAEVEYANRATHSCLWRSSKIDDRGAYGQNQRGNDVRHSVDAKWIGYLGKDHGGPWMLT